MEHGFDFGQEMRTWVSPSLIEANYILSLSRMELEHVIAAEMEANPALEADERATCPLCGSVLDGTFCATCLVSQAPPNEQESYEDFPESMLSSPVTREDSDEFDPMTLVAAGISVPDQVLADARTVLEEDEYAVAEYLIDTLDERGFLTLDLDELASAIGWERAAIEAVLEVIQDVAPVGVGARDLQECLLLQLRHLQHSGQEIPLHVPDIVALHLAAFGAHKYGHIARALATTTEEVEEAREFIRFHLNPFPLQSHEARSWRSPTDSGYVAPDVIISLNDDILRADVVDAKHFHLHMNSMYDQLSHDIGRGRGVKAKTNVSTET
ncbi:MAG: RNA polymerase factor sigma-54, partial [Thermomicrobiales bacterium]